MTIRTYSNRLISSFQSTVHKVLADTGEPVENHPIMQATCDALVKQSEHVQK